MWHIWGKGEVNPEFWWGNLIERDHTHTKPRHRWVDNMKMDLQQMRWGKRVD